MAAPSITLTPGITAPAATPVAPPIAAPCAILPACWLSVAQALSETVPASRIAINDLRISDSLFNLHDGPCPRTRRPRQRCTSHVRLTRIGEGGSVGSTIPDFR